MPPFDTSETLLTLAEAAKLIPSSRPGKTGVNISTLWRWCMHGVRGVKLESISIGASRYTSREAIDRFVAACSSAPGQPPATRTARQRRRDHERAERELDRMGVK